MYAAATALLVSYFFTSPIMQSWTGDKGRAASVSYSLRREKMAKGAGDGDDASLLFSGKVNE